MQEFKQFLTSIKVKLDFEELNEVKSLFENWINSQLIKNLQEYVISQSDQELKSEVLTNEWYTVNVELIEKIFNYGKKYYEDDNHIRIDWYFESKTVKYHSRTVVRDLSQYNKYAMKNYQSLDIKFQEDLKFDMKYSFNPRILLLKSDSQEEKLDIEKYRKLETFCPGAKFYYNDQHYVFQHPDHKTYFLLHYDHKLKDPILTISEETSLKELIISNLDFFKTLNLDRIKF